MPELLATPCRGVYLASGPYSKVIEGMTTASHPGLTQGGSSQHEVQCAQHVHATHVAVLVDKGTNDIWACKSTDCAYAVENGAAHRDALSVQEGLWPARWKRIDTGQTHDSSLPTL